MKNSTRAARVALALVLVASSIVAVVALLMKVGAPAAPEREDGALPGARLNSHVLDEAGPGSPTLVVFLDFECEVCGAFYPVIEELREDYAGEINYVVRYFPLPGHVNSGSWDFR